MPGDLKKTRKGARPLLKMGRTPMRSGELSRRQSWSFRPRYEVLRVGRIHASYLHAAGFVRPSRHAPRSPGPGGYEVVAQAHGRSYGITGRMGNPSEDGPRRSADIVPGMVAAFGILAADASAAGLARGQFVEIAMVDAVSRSASATVYQALRPGPHRRGPRAIHHPFWCRRHYPATGRLRDARCASAELFEIICKSLGGEESERIHDM